MTKYLNDKCASITKYLNDKCASITKHFNYGRASKTNASIKMHFNDEVLKYDAL